MTARIATLLFVVLIPLAAKSGEIVPTVALGTPVTGRVDGWNGHVDYVQWAGDSVVCGGRSGFVRCYDPKTKRQRWSAQLVDGIDSFSASVANDRLYLLDRRNTIHQLRLSDGKATGLVSSDLLGRRAVRSFLIPHRIAWIPVADQLLVVASSMADTGDGILFDLPTFKQASTIKCDDFVTDITTDASGRFIVTLSARDNVRIWDTKTDDEIFKKGKDEVPAIDVPFISNAMFDGDRTLVYTVDKSWATGTVYVHDIRADKELARFDSRNGHAVMDVDFVRSRIALTGTDRGLTVLNLAGEVIAEKAAVTRQRNMAVGFSPDGKRLAVGSWDNTVRIFEVREGRVE